MKTIKKYSLHTWRTIRITLECFVGFLIAFWCFAVILSRIGTSPEVVSEQDKKITVYITSNGIHTDVVMPLHTKEWNWVHALKLPDSLLHDSIRTHLAVGWGDKGFFLETKSWADVKVSVVFKAAFHLGSSAMHLVHVPKPDRRHPQTIELKLTVAQYRRLIDFVQASFSKDGNNVQMITEHPYGRYNYFYEADRSYGLTYTCNSWTNSALKSCGQRACVWTAFKGGIYLQYGKVVD